MLVRRITAVAVAALLAVGSIVATPLVASAAPAQPTNATVTAADTDQRTVTLQWDKVEGATSYVINLSKSDDQVISNIVTLTSTTNSITPTAFLLATSSDEEVIHWRVAAVSSAGAGAYLLGPSFTRAKIAAPTAIKPLTGDSFEFPAPVSFEWNPVAGASTYSVEYSTSSTFATKTRVDDVTGTSFTPSGSLPLGTWYWHVQAKVLTYAFTGGAAQSTALTTFSAAQSFTATWNNSRPDLLSAHDQSDTVTTDFLSDPIFTWTPVSGAASYRLVIGTAELDGLISGTKTTYTAYGSSIVPSSLLANQDYKWQVTAVDPAGNFGTPSLISSFKKRWGSQTTSTSASLTGTTTPTALTGGTTLGTSESIPIDELELKWEPVVRATNYVVSVYTMSGNIPGSSPTVTCTTASTSATIISSAASLTGSSGGTSTCLWNSAAEKRLQVYDADDWNITYKWGVVAMETDATGVTSAISTTSSVDTNPHYFTLTAPADGTVRNPDTEATTPDSSAWSVQAPLVGQPSPVFEWDAVAGAGVYEVEVALDRSFTTPVARFYTPSTKLRSNGVFDDTTTDEAYFWRVKGGIPATSAYTGMLGDASHWPSEDDPVWDAMTWTKNSTKTDVPSAATSVTQTNGSVTLRWKPQGSSALGDGGTRGYVVKIYSGPTATGTPVNGTAGTLSNYPFLVASATGGIPLTENATYTFRVAPLDALGTAGNYSDPVSFQVQSAAPVTTPVVSADVTSSATLRWAPTPGARAYRVTVTPPAGVTSLTDSIGASTSVFVVTQTALTISGITRSLVGYSWSVEAQKPGTNIYGAAGVGSFTAQPKPVTLDATAELAAFSSPGVSGRVLSWDPVPGATRYVVSFSPTLGTAESTIATSYVIPGSPAYGVTYTWTVTALGGPSVTSTGRTFLGSQSGTFTARTLPAQLVQGATSASGTTLNAIWTPPATPAARGAASVTYRVQVRVQPTAGATSDDWSALVADINAGTAVSQAVASLAFNTSYDVRVATVNSEGQGPWSATKSVKTVSTPTAAPTNLKATAALGSLTVSWSSVTGTGTGGASITGYAVRYKKSSDAAWNQQTSSGATATLTGLAQAVSYDVQVSALNALGEGPSAGITATTLAAPAAPAITGASRGDRTITVTWSTPGGDGGSPITGFALDQRVYSATTKTWSAWATTSMPASSASTVKSSLINGNTYEFRIAVKTKLATSAYSAVASAIPAGKPLAPLKPKLSTKKGKFIVKWSAAPNNGSAVTKYVVQYSTNGQKWKSLKTLSAKTKSYTTTKGKKGKLGYFRVVAKNAIGTGLYTPTLKIIKK